MVATDPYVVTRSGRLRFRYHAGQEQAMKSRARFILVLAGLQSGKTVLGPWWMLREMREQGPGDYLVAAPTFRLLDMKCLPEYRRLFVQRLQLGTLRENPVPLFTLSARGEEILFGAAQPNPTRILFGHAQDPDSLESATIKACHADEAGQKKFKRTSFEAILGRLSIFQGRLLVSSTPYTLGWLKSELHDPAKAGDPDYCLVNFPSTANPSFPKAEFEAMRQKLPGWKFRMRYLGEFERPAGVIYDVFTDACKVRRFAIPSDWKRYLGVDFGGVNTAAVYFAAERMEGKETGRYFIYRTYKAGGKTAAEHKAAILAGEPMIPRATGGSWSEDQWRNEFSAAGLPIHEPPIKDVEVGIDRVYGMVKSGRLLVFDDLPDLIDEFESYSRELDANDDPTEKIEDKETFHLLDATRYGVSHIEDKITVRPSTLNIPI